MEFNKKAVDAKTKKNAQKRKNTVSANKRTMNFVHHESKVDPVRILSLALVFLILAIVVLKFGIIDPLNERTQAYYQLALKQEQLAAVNQRLEGYDELEYNYGRYSYGWMSKSETSLVNRMEILQLVEEKIAPFAVAENINVNSNVLTMNIHGVTLEQASQMVKGIEEDPMVDYASVFSAVAQDGKEASINLSINLKKVEKESAD